MTVVGSPAALAEATGDPAAGAGGAGAGVHRAATAVLLGALGASVLVGLLERHAIGQLRHEVLRATPFAVLAVVTGSCAYVGMAWLAALAAPRVARRVRAGRRTPLAVVRSVAAGSREAIATVPDDRWFLVAWRVSCFGVIASPLVLVVAVAVLLPARAWGVAVFPAVDLVVTVAVRSVLHVGIRRRRRAAAAR